MSRVFSSVFLAAGVLCASIALSGCSGQNEPGAPTGQTPDEGMSLSSASNLVYECLTDRGWKVTLTWDGGIEAGSATVPDAQLENFNSDSDECWGMVDNRILNMQPEEISQTYAAELETRECLIERGFKVGTPPSEQQYIDTFQSARWSAYADSNGLNAQTSADEWREINEACPQPAWSLGAS
jgi:hypothetical protein